MTQYEHFDRGKPNNNEYATRPELWRPIRKAVGGFNTDPAGGAEAQDIADTVFTIAENGMSKDWVGKVWLNPPFSDKVRWYKKLIAERKAGNCTLGVALCPVDTSTQWFQNWFAQADLICWLEGRDWYVADGQPSFNTAVGVFGESPPELLDVLGGLGTVTQPLYEDTQATVTDF